MKPPSVRVTRCSTGAGFNVWHWQKFLGSRTTIEQANALAENKRRQLARQQMLKNMKKPAAPAPPRNPDAPERHWCTEYGNDGHVRRGWMWIFPAHPLHSSQELRRERHIVNSILHEEDTPDGHQPVTVINATLPPLETDPAACEWVTETNQDQPRRYQAPKPATTHATKPVIFYQTELI